MLIAAVSGVRDARRDAAQQADRLAANSAVLASLTAESAFRQDRAGVFAALRSISAMPGVNYARVEDVRGHLLAETGSGARLSRDAKVSSDQRKRSILSLLRSSTVEVEAPVVYARRPVGRVVLVGTAHGGLANLLTSLLISAAAAIVATGLGLAVAWRLQRRISNPIGQLTSAMADVRTKHQYHVLADVRADGEIGELVDGFNEMLREIQSRDTALALHMSGLENTVAERTKELVVARDAAESANTAKSDFLATMSHEIRTPMNGIMVMAEMLAAGELPKRQRRFAEVIAKSGSSLLAIINDILDFSKIEAGKMDLEEEPVDLAEVTEDVCALFWERARSKNLDLAAYVDPGTPALVAADPVRLRQIVGNLVNNAIKFTENGGVLVKVESRSGWLRISVHDTGIGIAEDKLDSVFGAFSQADQSTTRKFGGTGLGLAICKRLVEAMQGRLSVTSKLGKGSVFSVHMPVRILEPARPWPHFNTEGTLVAIELAGPSTRAAVSLYARATGAQICDVASAASALIAEPRALLQSTTSCPVICIGEYGDAAPLELKRSGRVHAILVQPFRRRDLEGLLGQLVLGQPLVDSAENEMSETPALPSFAGRRVLVADDSAVNREVAIEALGRLGIECECVKDGREAVEAVARGDYDLVLMDGSMPEMDGYEASLEIRRQEAAKGAQRLPIIALTAHVLGAAADAWRAADMDAVLHKPFTLDGLAKSVGQFIAASAALQAAVVAPRPVSVVIERHAHSDLLDPEVTAELERMAGQGGSDFADRVRQLYRDNAPDALRKVIEAAATNDPVAAALAAHALKSMSLNIGARTVAEVAARIEGDAREHSRVRNVDAQELHQKFLATLDALGGPSAQAADDADADAELIADLAKAADRGEFSLAYQPQVARDGSTLVGVEVLLRWTHPMHGPISPAIFVPIAERHGLMRPITRWVLTTAMRETRDLDQLTVSFNASALEFADPTFADELAVLISREGYDSKRLEVEVTETAILSDADDVRRTMERLHEIGLKIALDDFGVGYSSLSHLRLFPFDKLKIDKTFIDDCCTDVQSATLVHAVVSIGRALGMRVVAEGIESPAQQKFLSNAGVHAFQGYLYGKPEDIEALKIRASRASAAA